MGRKTSEEAMQKVRAPAGMCSEGPGPAPLRGARPKYAEEPTSSSLSLSTSHSSPWLWGRSRTPFTKELLKCQWDPVSLLIKKGR